jgi:hypothetical protein
MESLISLSGIAGAACCVCMYAAVSFGHVSAEKPQFFIANGGGAALILTSAAHDFDIGDLGTIGQELIWSVISIVGAVRTWTRKRRMV